MSDNGDELGLDNVFEEPPRPPTPPPTFTTYQRKTPGEWATIDIQLVGHHVLWAQHLWNAAIVLADYLDTHSSQLCKGKKVLELGAGGALPSLVAALDGAHQVVITDYPDPPLLDNITRNVNHNIPSGIRERVTIQGYVWGSDPRKLFETSSRAQGQAFDVIILSDLIFNHSQHAALLDTCEAALEPGRQAQNGDKSAGEDPFFVFRSREVFISVPASDPKDSSHEEENLGTPCVLVFFSHHRPQYVSRDLEFFARAKDRGWSCKQVVQTRMNAMFPDDPGDEGVRSTVHGWVLRRP